MGDGENWTNWKFRKLNWHKIYVSSFPNVNRNGISASAIMKKMKNRCHFVNINCTEKFQITSPTPKFGSLIFWVLTEMEYQCWPLWKSWKMAAILLISIVQKNFKLQTPPKFGSPAFRVVTETEYQCQPLWKKLKNGGHFINMDHMGKFQITDPPKFGSPVFQMSMEMEYQCQPFWKNWKMADNLLISIVRKITDPPKVWVSGFPSVNRNGISVSAIMKKLKNGCLSLISIIQKNFKIGKKEGLIPDAVGFSNSRNMGHMHHLHISFVFRCSNTRARIYQICQINPWVDDPHFFYHGL